MCGISFDLIFCASKGTIVNSLLPVPDCFDYLSVQFSHSVMSNSLQPHGKKHTKLPCPSPTPGACSNSVHWVGDAIQSSHPLSSLLLLPSIFPTIRVFLNESVLHIRWPKYWSFSFSISPSNEYSGLISFRMDWLDLLAVQGTLNSPRVQDNQESKTLFSNTTVQKHQFFDTQLSLWSNSYIHTWLLEKS